ncbi:MAG: DUF559 domain-containing protein [Firmicutes bacterium]|nr:DUF559 domain-containing protein [Bacillota bacterium]
MNDKLPYNIKLKDKAKELRKAGNLSEVLLWRQLNKKQLGVGFDRQKIIGNYIVDFYSAAIKTVIEIDGETHNEKADYDKSRDEFLKGLGLTVIHILDIDVKRNLDGVLSMIQKHIETVKYSL